MKQKRSRRHAWAPGLGRVVAALLMACAVAGPAAAQAPEVAVVQVRGLGFDALEPGRPSVISVLDAARRAEFLLVGEGPVQVQFILPEALTSTEGARIPLEYGPLDGLFVAGPSLEPVRFDPEQPQQLVIPAGMGEARLFLGAVALPAELQSAGQYAAPVTVLATRPQR